MGRYQLWDTNGTLLEEHDIPDPPPPQQPRDLAAELDGVKGRLVALEAKVNSLKKEG
jgi:hypothetical protein